MASSILVSRVAATQARFCNDIQSAPRLNAIKPGSIVQSIRIADES